MSDSNSNQLDMIQPRRPMGRGGYKYDVLREAEAVVRNLTSTVMISKKTELFTMTLTATTVKGDGMDKGENEKQFLIDLIFKPNENGIRPLPEEIQLILAHIGEILREIEAENDPS